VGIKSGITSHRQTLGNSAQLYPVPMAVFLVLPMVSVDTPRVEYFQMSLAL